MIFNRKWAMPDSRTFNINCVASLLNKYCAGTVIDPFANDSKYGTITNDLNPEYKTDYNLDAIDFLKIMSSGCADVVLYDPPYSTRQVVECYKGVGKEITKKDTQAKWRAEHLREISRITKDGGIVISFGWNSNGVGKKLGFNIIEILLIAHGGSKNDTIVTVEKKTQGSLNLFL